MGTIAINGLGRIGRTFLRVALRDALFLKQFPLVAINIGPACKETLPSLLSYDTIMGPLAMKVSLKGDQLSIGDHHIAIYQECDARQLPWKKHGITWVVEASGHYTRRELAVYHQEAGAQRVLITAPAENEDSTIILGVNETSYVHETHRIVSLGSCTTNALLPLLKIVDNSLGIEYGFMTTIHAYTNSQALLDGNHQDARKARAAALNVIPTSTGVGLVLGKVMPHLKDRVTTQAVRVPVPNGSLLGLSFVAKKDITRDVLHEVCLHAAHSSMKGIVSVSSEMKVSTDYYGDPHSVILDTTLTQIAERRAGVLYGWYDNEWGYSSRIKDFLMKSSHFIASQ
ncbi:MAG: glyceraldehyde 3-phosphate dehydrogenase NAD-binding domain-containing protein [Candidatus Babeliales bacterium]